MKLDSAVHFVCTLGPADRDAMFHLMEQNYANLRRSRFDADLAAKHWVILVRRPDDNRLVGFSTQVVLETHVGSECVRALYSGDTVVDRAHWGDAALAHAWGNFALGLIDEQIDENRRLYWFLTSKGFRTYHYLPLFFHRYFPHPVSATPPSEQNVIHAFGAKIGGDRYEPRRAIIRADGRSDFVRPEIAEPHSRRINDPRACYFVKANPGFARGDELCCIAPLTRENFTPAAYRVMSSRPYSARAV
jgi:hypothetical protein